MLKDLNENKSHLPTTPTYIPKQKKNFWQRLPYYMPWMVGTFGLSLLILLLSHGYPNKNLKKPNAPIASPNVPIFIQAAQPPQLKNDPIPATIISVLPSFHLVKEQEENHPSVIQPIPVLQNVSHSENELNLPFEEFPTEEVGTPAEVNKIYSRLTPQEWRDEQLNKALDAIEQGNNSSAIRILDFLLYKFPYSVEGRESLAAIYISQNALNEAMRVVDEGLYLIPHSVRLNTMKARLLFEQDQVEEALGILDQFKPDIYKEPDFYGLRAAILQTVGRIAEAGSIYKILVEIESSNGQYWLGYGITLENKHKINQAVDAYKRVTECFDIEPSVRDYAEKRLKHLQG